MPDCPNCSTWNPEDKTVCWRCQAELPRPQSRKLAGKRKLGRIPLHMWIALVFFVVMMLAAQCFAMEYTRLAG